MVVGSNPCSSLYSVWISRRRRVSSMADAIASVVSSAYSTTSPLTFRAARPIVWTSVVSDLRKPSWSASRMATRDTSGMSRPSRSRLMPTSTSISPSRRDRINSWRSRVSVSSCM
jgi:hypothetical protein